MFDDEWDQSGMGRVQDLRRRAECWLAAARRDGENPMPLLLSGKKIAKRFWGKAWCAHIEGLQDYASRLPRGRSYVLNGAIVDLQIAAGRIDAKVLGENLYEVHIGVALPDSEALERLRRRCAGQVGCLVDLLEGRMGDELIAMLCEPEAGLFPRLEEFHLDCNCPDWADLCKHLAAVLYGVGARLDVAPELLFTLRGIRPEDLCMVNVPAQNASMTDSAALSDVFGVDIE